MKRVLVAAVAMLALGSAGAAVVQAAIPQANAGLTAHKTAQVIAHKAKKPKAVTATINVSSTPAGEVLTSKKPGGSGQHVLFIFAKDKQGAHKDACKPIKNCETDWPPVTTTGKVKLGKGVEKSKVHTIGYDGRVKEVTYDGYPLHYYKFDDGAAVSFTFIGIKQFGGPWYALTAAGKIVKNPAG